MPDRRHWTVGADEHGARLDRWLTDTAGELSRARLQALIREGRLTIGGAVVTEPNYRVKRGDDVTLDIPPPAPLDLAPEQRALEIVFEDEHLLVLIKPAGLVVHPAPGHDKGTLVHALLAHCGDSLSGIGGVQRPGIIHRIDKDVSGLLVVAKHDKAHMGLAGQFTVHSVERSYQAIVYGRPTPPNGQIDRPIGRHPKDRKRQAIVASGKRALTDYRLLEQSTTLSRLLCTLHTGRTHQIRVHLAGLGTALVGDTLYRPRRKPKLPGALDEAVGKLDRIALHAAVLGFDHPVSGERHRYEAPCPPEIDALMVLACAGSADGSVPV